MDKNLKKILYEVQNNNCLNEDEVNDLQKAVKSVDNEMTILSFKLDRTEKVKRTTGILLEETIEELEQKRKLVEEQAREAQIEVALERVRSRSMAMHSSDEFVDASDVMFYQLKKLGIEALRIGIGIMNTENNTVEIWSRSEIKGKAINTILGVVPSGLHPIFDNMVKAWKEDKPYFSSERVGDEVREYYEKLSSSLSYPQPMEYNERESITTFFFTEGSLNVISLEPLKEEDCNIMIRFAKVFGQVYQRFLDLQNAEAQAREAQIETALERIRSKSMAMHKSEELADLSLELVKQVQALGVATWFCAFNIYDDDPQGSLEWGSNGEITFPKYRTPREGIFLRYFEVGERGETFLINEIGENECSAHYDYLCTLPGVGEQLLKMKDSGIPFPSSQIDHVAYFKYGYIIFITYEPVPKSHDIFKRFAKVFEQTYTRFLDLQKAEAQAREAQIELALERIRAQAMAMRESSDLLDIVVTMRTEFVALEHEAHYFWHMRWLPEMYEKAMTSGDGTRIGMVMELPRGFHENTAMLEWEKNSEPIGVFAYDADGAIDYVDKMIKKGRFREIDHNAPGPDDIREIGGITFIMARTTHGEIGYSLPGVVTDPPTEDLSTLVRFAGAFDLAYKRFEDLNEVEAQNKIIKAENERKSQELEEARELQLSMLPRELPKLLNLDIAVNMQTATEVGGDYYDFHLEADGTLTTVIGDATGHGMKAGTIVTITKSLFHSLASGKDILSSFAEISRVIKGMNFRQLSMCMIMLKIKDDKLSISSAAMPPTLIYRSKNKTVEEIEFQGMPLGAMKKFPYQIKETELQNGDTIFLFSDGLPELMNGSKEMYGYDRTKTEFHSVAEKEPEEIVEHLKNSASQWVKGKDPDDDVTFVVIKVK